MDIGDFKKIRTQQDLKDYLDGIDNAIQAILMNDGVDSQSVLYCSLRLCQDTLFFARGACREFDVDRNSFKDE